MTAGADADALLATPDLTYVVQLLRDSGETLSMDDLEQIYADEGWLTDRSFTWLELQALQDRIQSTAVPRSRGLGRRCRLCHRQPSRLIPCRVCRVKMGGGCCAIGHIPGAMDGICFACHNKIHVQDANPQYRIGRPPRQHTADRHPYWTQGPSWTRATAEAEDGDSDDAQWLMSIHEYPDRNREDRDATSAYTAETCAICRNGPSMWQDHKYTGGICSTCASDRGIGPFAISPTARSESARDRHDRRPDSRADRRCHQEPQRRQHMELSGHATGPNGRAWRTAWQGTTTSVGHPKKTHQGATSSARAIACRWRPWPKTTGRRDSGQPASSRLLAEADQTRPETPPIPPNDLTDVDEVGREVGGRYSIKELERRIVFNDGKAYVWEEVREYYTSRGWFVYQARDH